MALDYTVKVDLPPHCVMTPKNGSIYVQYTVRAYRNEKGKPTSKRVAIGKLDSETGMLIPNRNYYEVVEKNQTVAFPAIVRANGTHAVFTGIAKELGLIRILKKHFPDRYRQILTAAHYMLCKGNVMYYLSDWLEENISFSPEVPGSADLSRLFAGIGRDERIAFFSDWMAMKKSKEYIAYDVTSISSYGKKMGNLEWGYNRDKEKLPQINFGMYFGEESMLPLYYRIYPGSIPDTAHLRYMTQDNEIISCKKARFVMDRGFYSAENLTHLVNKGCRFVIAVPGHLKLCTKLIEEHREELVNHSECHLGTGLPYGKSYEVTEYGFRMRVHLYYDPCKGMMENERLYELIDKTEYELSQMETPPDRKQHYDRYFFINRAADGSLAYRRNPAAIDRALSVCGFFVIAETDFTKTTAEILDIYRRRDVIEKSFDNLKNDIDMRRLYVQSDEVADGKAFVAFLALIVRSQMHNVLQPYISSHNLTFQKILLELDKIKLIFSASAPGNCRLLNPPTKTQKDILACCAIDPSSLATV